MKRSTWNNQRDSTLAPPPRSVDCASLCMDLSSLHANGTRSCTLSWLRWASPTLSLTCLCLLQWRGQDHCPHLHWWYHPCIQVNFSNWQVCTATLPTLQMLWSWSHLFPSWCSSWKGPLYLHTQAASTPVHSGPPVEGTLMGNHSGWFTGMITLLCFLNTDSVVPNFHYITIRNSYVIVPSGSFHLSFVYSSSCI